MRVRFSRVCLHRVPRPYIPYIVTPVPLETQERYASSTPTYLYTHTLEGWADAAGHVKLDVHASGNHEVRREGERPELSLLPTFLGEPVRHSLSKPYTSI